MEAVELNRRVRLFPIPSGHSVRTGFVLAVTPLGVRLLVCLCDHEDIEPPRREFWPWSSVAYLELEEDDARAG